MFKLTDVVKNLLILNVLFFLGSMAFPVASMKLAMYPILPMSNLFEPYQLVTHMFMHAGGMHLFFNMFGLVMFGPILEYYWGAKRFGILYFAAGFGALLLHVLVTWYEVTQLGGMAVPVLGASGAIFGLLAAFAVLFPNKQLMLLFPPIPIKAKYLVTALIIFDLVSGISRSGTGIAHFAHVGGALFGGSLAWYWRSNP